MPKLSEGTVAVGGLLALAIWLLVGLPMLYAPPFGELGQQKYTTSSESTSQPTNNKPDGSASAPFVVQMVPGPKSAQERSQEAEDREEKKSAEKGLVRWTAALFVATVGLILATAVLGYFGFQQSRDMKASIAVAAKAANAAEMNAKLAVAAELPEIIVNRIFVRPFDELTESPRSYPADNSKLIIDLHNVGRSRATIEKVCFESVIALDLPEDPPYVHILPVDTLLKADDSFEFTVRNFSLSLGPEELNFVNAGYGYLWLYGFVRYRDHHLRSITTVGFCARWHTGCHDGPDPGYYQEGPSTYIYKRTEEQA
jgi:hypothetical protein